MAGDALVVAAAEGCRQTEMRGAGLFPEARLLRPISVGAGAPPHPSLDPDLGGVAAGLCGEAAQLAEDVESALVGRIGVRHPAVAPFGDARQGAFVIPAIPHRHLARGGTRVDAGVLDRMPLALVGDMRLGPQLLHNLHLLLRAAAAIVKILVEPQKLDLVPAQPDAEPETPP